MARVSRSDLRRVAARTWLLQATWNYERQQGLGWAWCLAPVLGRGLRERLERLVSLLSEFGAALVGVVVAALLVPGGEPQSLTFQVTLAGGLALGLVAAQRARPSATPVALGAGVLCLVAAWFR